MYGAQDFLLTSLFCDVFLAFFNRASLQRTVQYDLRYSSSLLSRLTDALKSITEMTPSEIATE